MALRVVLFFKIASLLSLISMPVGAASQQTWRVIHVVEQTESRWLCASSLDENGAVVRRL
jgi:hypothetical protein